jgi:hypothetical protein
MGGRLTTSALSGNDSYASESTSFNLDLRNINHRLESMVSNYRTLSQSKSAIHPTKYCLFIKLFSWSIALGEAQKGEHEIASEEKGDAANENMKLQRRVSELENLLQSAREGQVAMDEERERCISSLHHTYEKAYIYYIGSFWTVK